jgi:hypothetical protein
MKFSFSRPLTHFPYFTYFGNAGQFRKPSQQLHGEVAFEPQLFSLVLSVPPKYVASCFWLEVPRRDQHDVSVSDPYAPFQFASDSAQSFLAILALDQYSVKAKHFDCHSQHIILAWQQHVFQVFFINDFSFTQLSHLQNHQNIVA